MKMPEIKVASNDIKFAMEVLEVATEYNRARRLHAPMHSVHEGYAVLKEEVDELWDEIKRNDLHAARKEAVQVAAMALAFIREVTPARGTL